MNYGELQAAVNSTFSGRSDIPSHVYEITLAEFNRDLRTVDMQETATISADAEYEALPADFLEAISLYLEIGGNRVRLQAMHPDALNYWRPSSGVPKFYAVTEAGLKLFPTPDSTYSLELRYYEQIAALASSGDTNVILTRYPELYLYTALKHAAFWSRDDAMIATHMPMAEAAKRDVMASERKRLVSGPWISRPARDLRTR